READRRLAGRDRDDENGKDLAGQVGEPPRERDQVQVDGVQHQLDRHEHGQEVAAHENAQKTDRKQEKADNQVMVDRDRHQSTRSIVRLPRTTAPIMATRRKTEATSNGKRYSRYSSHETASVLPTTRPPIMRKASG